MGRPPMLNRCPSDTQPMPNRFPECTKLQIAIKRENQSRMTSMLLFNLLTSPSSSFHSLSSPLSLPIFLSSNPEFSHSSLGTIGGNHSSSFDQVQSPRLRSIRPFDNCLGDCVGDEESERVSDLEFGEDSAKCANCEGSVKDFEKGVAFSRGEVFEEGMVMGLDDGGGGEGANIGRGFGSPIALFESPSLLPNLKLTALGSRSLQRVQISNCIQRFDITEHALS